ncbi:MAG: hypothetical protein WBZ33_16040 [Thermoactinomyces sp.]
MSKLWLDLRWLTGLMFLVYGAILIVYGLAENPQTPYLHGLNIDLWWGVVTFVIGVLFAQGPLRNLKKIS